MAQIKDLFKAYMANELPTDGGLIITSYFDLETTYTKYEVTAYNNVKDIYRNDEGIVFQADGYKQFIVVEPATYSRKHTEPAMRDRGHAIPYRFKEVETFISKRQDTIMLGKEPVITYTSFTILQPVGDSFAFIVYKENDLLKTVENFFAASLWHDARVPKADADKVAKTISKTLQKILNPAVA
jgi:hypothetical protein